MKKIELFVCEHCGTQYATKEQCKLCESIHCPPKEIKSCRYIPYKSDKTGYPITVQIEMSDGRTVTYKR